jgi:flagellar biosynthesis/type III secretory pathway M-ring protein FliF/YscJ
MFDGLTLGSAEWAEVARVLLYVLAALGSLGVVYWVVRWIRRSGAAEVRSDQDRASAEVARRELAERDEFIQQREQIGAQYDQLREQSKEDPNAALRPRSDLQ